MLFTINTKIQKKTYLFPTSNLIKKKVLIYYYNLTLYVNKWHYGLFILGLPFLISEGHSFSIIRNEQFFNYCIFS